MTSPRSLLGAADVTDAQLHAFVADLLAEPDVEVLTSHVEPVAYDVPALTTVGRWWVGGRARTPRGETPFRMFVKHVQAWVHSPHFAAVPDPVRELAAAGVPWRTERAVYRSDLAHRLPDGLSMPRALGVVDVEPDGYALWLTEVTAPPRPWDAARHVRAAGLLGRLAASRDVAELAEVGAFDWSLWHYVDGRLSAAVVPALLDDAPWRHPCVAAGFDPELRRRLRAAAGRIPELTEELAAAPRATAHGDASPGNLLPAEDPDGFTLIDFGFWLPQPIGFDLGQLLAGDVQLGRGSAALLEEVGERCVRAYAAGLAAEGRHVDVDVVRRAHALQLLLFCGLSSVPIEMLDAEPSPGLERVCRERAALARYALDLVDATASGA